MAGVPKENIERPEILREEFVAAAAADTTPLALPERAAEPYVPDAGETEAVKIEGCAALARGDDAERIQAENAYVSSRVEAAFAEYCAGMNPHKLSGAEAVNRIRNEWMAEFYNLHRNEALQRFQADAKDIEDGPEGSPHGDGAVIALACRGHICPICGGDLCEDDMNPLVYGHVFHHECLVAEMKKAGVEWTMPILFHARHAEARPLAT